MSVPLPNVCLWACVWSDSRTMLERTLRVLRYCRRHFDFGRTVFFSWLEPPHILAGPAEFMQIPRLTPEQWNVFHNRVTPLVLAQSEFALSVHEDGFPLRPELWSPDFLQYDLIGSPWAAWNTGRVGNMGFCIESRRFLEAKTRLPYATAPIVPSDDFVCKLHRGRLEAQGIRFAPTEVALRFSTEQTGRDFESFGFHGRNDQPEKYRRGWRAIEASETL